MEIHFTDASAAALPQTQLSALSKAQLIRTVTVLQAGWSTAIKRLNALTRNRESEDLARSEELAESHAKTSQTSSKVESLIDEVRKHRARIAELESEVAHYRCAANENPDNPEAVKLRADYTEAQSRILSLERLLRLRELINLQHLRIKIEEMEKQRDNDRRKIIFNSTRIVQLEQQLVKAREEASLPMASTPHIVTDQAPAQPTTAPKKRYSDCGSQTAETSLDREQLDAVVATMDSLVIQRNALEMEVETLRDIVAYDQALPTSTNIDAVESLLAHASTHVGCSASAVELETERMEMKQTIADLQSCLLESQHRAASAEQQVADLTRKLEQFASEFATIADENIHLLGASC